jgi:pimeloyl-ACP methyl ester carboxylesterase
MLHLHYKAYGHSGRPLIILHGLLGMLDNWQTQSRKYAAAGFRVYALDLRNHGRSPHSETFHYGAMAEDIKNFMSEHRLDSAYLLGHSMGGKAAMQVALTYPHLVEKLVVVDVAPRRYASAHACVPEGRTSACRHDDILDAMCSLNLKEIATRQQADLEIGKRIPNFALRQFILKNLSRTDSGSLKWKVNLSIIRKHYPEIADDITARGKFDKPSLFIKGGGSSYIVQADEPRIKRLFPHSKIVTIHGAGHWVHAEKPDEFANVVLRFLLRH